MVFNYELTYSDKEMSLVVPVQVKPIKEINLKEALNVKAETKDGLKATQMTYYIDKNEIKPIEKFNRGWFDSEGKLRDKSEIEFYVEIDGQKQKVKQFSRSKKLEINLTIPKADTEQFLTTKKYQVYSTKPNLLFKLAKKLAEKNNVGVCELSFGGFKKYMAILKPYLKGNKFIMFMDLATSKINIDELNLMDTEAKEEAEIEKIPTLTDLAILKKKLLIK